VEFRQASSYYAGFNDLSGASNAVASWADRTSLE
jgi:hypothetical protein